jgi:hypothetical protein
MTEGDDLLQVAMKLAAHKACPDHLSSGIHPVVWSCIAPRQGFDEAGDHRAQVVESCCHSFDILGLPGVTALIALDPVFAARSQLGSARDRRCARAASLASADRLDIVGISMTQPRPPSSEAEFNAAMEQIDLKLQRESVPIHARAMRASLEYSRLFRLEFPMALGGGVGTPGNFSDRNVEAHIRDWFARRYGERQKIFMGPGRTAVVIRGDPWELRLPLVLGQIRFVIERDLDRYKEEPSVGVQGRVPIVNVLRLVESLPQSLAAQLTDQECGDILTVFRNMLECMNAIGDLDGKPYVAEARADIAAAVTHIFDVPPHYGQSKWASLQAAEKLLKSFLKSRGVRVPRSHDLKGLAKVARSSGASIDDTRISLVAAPASVRYGEIPVLLSEALDAHHASLFIGRQISVAFTSRP